MKSLLGETCDRVRITEHGVEFDRALAIYGCDGKIASGKTTARFRKMANLFQMRSWVEHATIYVEAPAGVKRLACEPEAWSAVSEVVGEEVEIRPEDSTPHKDVAPIHLITSASLRWVRALRPGFDGAAVRFRPNILIDVGGVDRVEDAWVGKTLQIGSCQLRVTQRVERCVMPTLAQAGLPFLPAMLKTLTEHSGACLGVYAETCQPGDLAVGDEVILRT